MADSGVPQPAHRSTSRRIQTLPTDTHGSSDPPRSSSSRRMDLLPSDLEAPPDSPRRSSSRRMQNPSSDPARRSSSRRIQILPLDLPDGSPRVSSSRSIEETNASAVDFANEILSMLANDNKIPRGDTVSAAAAEASHITPTLSAAIEEELDEIVEGSFEPQEVLTGGLGKWHDRSLGVELLKRSQSGLSSRSAMDRTVSSGSKWQPPRVLNPPELSYTGPKHWYPPAIDSPSLTSSAATASADANGEIVSTAYASALSAAPNSTLIHLVMLYHRVLEKHSLHEEAHEIASLLSALEDQGDEFLEKELTGIDVLLKNGLLKYLMRIQPFISPIPTQVVRFKDVTFTTTMQVDPGYESIATKLVDCAKGPFRKSPLEKVILLKNVTGYIMPGTLTLVLGSPGSGKNVFSNVISGRWKEPGNTLEGSVTYNGRNVNHINHQRLVSVVEPEDIHMAPLTVRETLEFASECTQFIKPKLYGQELKEIMGEAFKAGGDMKLEMNINMLGLRGVIAKPVGSPMMPTLSENEMHRLSVAEMMAGTYAVYMFQNLNRGIDDSLTFDLISSVRIFTRVRQTSVVATLILPSPELFDLFDRIILLHRGRVVYQGPRQDALLYFEKLGYVKPRHESTSAFLEEVPTANGARFLQPGFPRLDLDGFEAAYKNSDIYKDICRIVDSPEVVQDLWVQGSKPLGVNFTRLEAKKGETCPSAIVGSLSLAGGSLLEVSMNHTSNVQAGDELVAVGGTKGMLNYLKVESSKGTFLPDQPPDPVRLQFERSHKDWEVKQKHPQFEREYLLDPWPEFLLLLNRDLKVTWRNKLGLYIRAFQVVVLSLFLGLIFLRIKRDTNQLDMNLFRGVTFLTLLDMTLFNLGQLPGLMQERAIYYKQQGGHFYRPSSYLFAKVVGSLPISFAEATVWTLIVYFLTNFAVSEGGWHFWVFYLLTLMTVLHGAAMVRCISALAPDLATASSIIGLLLPIFILFNGFLVPRRLIPKYWIWAYYLDPLQHGITALMINEFTSHSHNVLCKDVTNLSTIPQCRGLPNETVGRAFLLKSQFRTGYHWIAISVSVMLGWTLLWTSLNYYALLKLRHKPRQSIVPVVEARFRRYERTLDLERMDASVIGRLSLDPLSVTLSWHELSYNILIPSLRKAISIVNHVSGWAAPGEMLAVLGPTGSGKTTFLNCLAGRNVSPGRIGGEILVNGYPKVQAAFARVSGYVDKLEAYSVYMTVKEVVAFNTALQLDQTTTRQQRVQFVDEIIALMELESIQNDLVKSVADNKCTLSEFLRVGIASELGRNPGVLFLDEPFKNLDSTYTGHLVRTLKVIADTGRVVIAVLQNPSQRILNYFNSVQILKIGGETVYFGPVGENASYIEAYFASIPGAPSFPKNTSIASYAIDITGDKSGARIAPKDYGFEYRVSDLAMHNHIQLQRLKRRKGEIGPEIADESRGYSFSTGARYIFMKLQKYYWRNIPYSFGRLLSSVITALLLGSVYFNIAYDTTIKMQVRSSSLYLATLLSAMANIQSVLPQFLVQRQNYAREKASNQYNFFLYGISWTLGEVQYLGLATFINSAIFCLMVQMAVDNASDFFRYWFVTFELTLGLTFMGMFLITVCVSPQIASVVVTIIVGFWTATSGVVIPKKKIASQGVWVYWTNPLQYALNSLTSIAFYCDVDQPSCLNGGRNQQCSTTPSACPECFCPRLKDANNVFVWTQLKFNRTLDYERIGYDMLALLGFIVFFRAATIMVWTYRDNKAKKKED